MFIICGKELLAFSRDRRTLRAMTIFPLIFIPLVVYMFSMALRNPKIAFIVVVPALFQCIPAFFLSMISYFAFDITAGEKDRGTMETTLSLFATRKELVLGKYCAIVAANLIAGVIIFFFLLISYLSAKLMLSDFTLASFSSFDPRPYICYVVTLLYYAAFYPALLLLIGLFARSTKEAFACLPPILMVSIFAVVAPFYGVHLTLITVLIPGLNCYLIAQQFLRYSVDWIYWVILFSSVIVYSLACIKGSMCLMERDTILNRT